MKLNEVNLTHKPLFDESDVHLVIDLVGNKLLVVTTMVATCHTIINNQP